MSSLNKYQYEPLTKPHFVRILVLGVASGNESPLTCTIIQRPREAEHPGYYAISYVWGEQDFSSSLEILDESQAEPPSFLSITRNVDNVLRRFRSEKEEQHLWIDAVCLNQEDNAEKAQQVPIMGSVYEQAKAVHVWLGPEDAHTMETVGILNRILLPRWKDGLVWHLQVDENGEQVFPDWVDSVYRFCKQPWFYRHWVIQEACLARRALLHRGRHTISLEDASIAAQEVNEF